MSVNDDKFEAGQKVQVICSWSAYFGNFGVVEEVAPEDGLPNVMVRIHKETVPFLSSELRKV